MQVSDRICRPAPVTCKSAIRFGHEEIAKSEVLATFLPINGVDHFVESTSCPEDQGMHSRRRMPTALHVGPYSFFFSSSDRTEPVHVHVQRDGRKAKFWLNPVLLAKHAGFKKNELRRITRLVIQYEKLLIEAWNDFFFDT